MTELAMTNDEAMRTWLDEQKRQQNAPGTLSPCPFCGTPRNQRSDYVRCRLCGINWLDGEDLTCDPRNARMAAYVKSVRSGVPGTPMPSRR
jgi:hypothetical protein